MLIKVFFDVLICTLMSLSTTRIFQCQKVTNGTEYILYNELLVLSVQLCHHHYQGIELILVDNLGPANIFLLTK